MASYNCYLIDKQGNPVFYAAKPDLSKGDLFISVSQVLAMEGGGDFLIQWALREFGGQLKPTEAYRKYMDTVSTLGSKLHKWIEYDLKGMHYPDNELTEDMVAGIESWDAFKAEHEIELVDSERVLFSRELRVAGTMDLRVKIDGVLYVADLKTGSVQDKAFTQLTAYKHMLKEMGLSDGSEKLLVLGGADSKNKIANGGAVQMHTLDNWFSSSVCEQDLFTYFMALRHLWFIKNTKSRKFEPIIKDMAKVTDPLVERFKAAFISEPKKKKVRKNARV